MAPLPPSVLREPQPQVSHPLPWPCPPLLPQGLLSKGVGPPTQCQHPAACCPCAPHSTGPQPWGRHLPLTPLRSSSLGTHVHQPGGTPSCLGSPHRRASALRLAHGRRDAGPEGTNRTAQPSWWDSLPCEPFHVPVPEAGPGRVPLWPLRWEWVWHTASWQKPSETPATLPAPGLPPGHEDSPRHGHCGIPEPTQAARGPSTDLPALTQARVLTGKTPRRVRTGPHLPPRGQEPGGRRGHRRRQPHSPERRQRGLRAKQDRISSGGCCPRLINRSRGALSIAHSQAQQPPALQRGQPSVRLSGEGRKQVYRELTCLHTQRGSSHCTTCSLLFTQQPPGCRPPSGPAWTRWPDLHGGVRRRPAPGPAAAP